MSDLERRLASLARDLEWPPSPELAAPVGEALRDAPRPSPSRGRPLVRGLALALLVLLLLAGAVAAAVPDLRHEVLEALGLRGATIERREPLPPLPQSHGLELGSRVTLRQARRRLHFDGLLPVAAGRPGALYVRSSTPGGELAAAYRPSPGLRPALPIRLGLLVTEFRGDLHPDYLGKIVATATTVERLRVGDFRAVWVAGAPHFFFYRGRDGRLREESLRLAANALLVQRGGLLVRLEGAFSRRRAIALARSLRPAGTIDGRGL